MSSNKQNTRSSMRRKMVLPVTVIRSNGQEKQLAHTLDLTEGSARLGGLSSVLEPGEIIEIQRGAVKARFQVFWMGAPGSAMEGQAGVRIVDPGKSIWGANFPADEPDIAVDAHAMRKEMPPTRTEVRDSSDKRWHTRFECTGGASVRAQGTGFPVHGQVKDIARGGVYVETTTPLTVNTEVHVKMNVEGLPVESVGVVRTSYPMVGMGISFQDISSDNQERLNQIIEVIRRRTSTPKSLTEPALEPAAPAKEPVKANTQLRLDVYPVRVLAMACRMLAADFDEWKTERSSAELEELRLAVIDLHRKLSPPAQLGLVEYEPPAVPQGGHRA